MLEKDIEKRIVEKIKSKGLEGLEVCGLWTPAESGLVKNVESSGQTGGLIVKVSPRKWETFGFSSVSLSVTLSLAVRLELDPTGERLVEYCEAISDLLKDWNSVKSGDELKDFEVDGFVPGGVQVSAGAGPDFDGDGRTWSVVFNFTLRGAAV